MRYLCPTCKKPVEAPEKDNHAEVSNFPFCCRRCQLIDLGAWFDENYKIPAKSPQTENPTDNDD